jgi:hypothetical protein
MSYKIAGGEYNDAGQLTALSCTIPAMEGESSERFAARMDAFGARLSDLAGCASLTMQFVTPRRVQVRVVLAADRE